MKNKMFKLLALTILAGTLLVGCGGNETNTDNGADTKAETNVVEEKAPEAKEMSAEAVAYLDEIRARAAQVNEERVVIKEEHPTADVPHIEEAESKDGLECFGNFSHKFGSADELEMMLIFFRTEVYDKYYIEYVDETDTSVEFNFYCTMQ